MKRIKINKKVIASVLADVITFSLLGGLCLSVYYNITLQEQIEERDKLIQDLSFNKELVEKYFDIEIDTIKHMTYYTLKDKYQSRQIHKEIEKIRITELSKDSAAFADIKRMYYELEDDYSSLQHKYNNLVEDWNNNKNQKEAQKIALSLIEKSFGITYESKIDSNNIYVKLHSEKADSAFLLYPYFKNRLNKTKEGTWTIEVDINRKKIND